MGIACMEIFLHRLHLCWRENMGYDYRFDGVAGDANAFCEILKSDWCDKEALL